MIHLDKFLLNQILRTESNVERKDVVAPGKAGCIMPRKMFLRKSLEVLNMKNHFKMTFVCMMQPITESFSFAVFLGYANASQTRDEPQCKEWLGKNARQLQSAS